MDRERRTMTGGRKLCSRNVSQWCSPVEPWRWCTNFENSRSLGKTNILKNLIQPLSNCWEGILGQFARPLLKRDIRKVNSSVTRMLDRVTVAVLHVALKIRVGGTKILGNDVLPLSNCSKG